MYNNRKFMVVVSDSSYNYKETVICMSELAFSQLKTTSDGFRKNDRGRLIYRVSNTVAKQIAYKTQSDEFSKAIAKKYNIHSDWSSNRWFEEQVRPVL